jgi:hypothetical protein
VHQRPWYVYPIERGGRGSAPVLSSGGEVTGMLYENQCSARCQHHRPVQYPGRQHQATMAGMTQAAQHRVQYYQGLIQKEEGYSRRRQRARCQCHYLARHLGHRIEVNRLR